MKHPTSAITRPLLLLLFCLAGGCRGHEPAPSTEHVAASARSGAVTIAEVEQLLRGLTPQLAPDGGADPIVELYRRTAEEVVVRRVLDLEIGRVQDGTLSAERDRHLRLAVAELYARERVAGGSEVTDGEARAWFEQHGELFRQPARRTVQHLFRRFDDPDHPETTVAFVAALREQLVAGASFATLAREHSHSETRATGGRLGVVTRGKLPPQLEDVVFALEIGQPSAPVVTKDGVLLFLVTAAVEDRNFPFEDVRLQIIRELQEQRRTEALEKAVSDVPLPSGSIVLDEGELVAAMAGDDEKVVLECDGVAWTFQAFQEAYQEAQLQRPPPLVPELELPRFYHRLVLAQRLYLKAVADGFVDERAEAVQAAEQQVISSRLRRRVVEDHLRKMVEESPDEVRRFYDDTSYLYQTPLRLRLRALEAPLGDRPAMTVATVESFRPDLETGRLTLDLAAREIGGAVVETGWVSPPELAVFEPKVRHYLLSMLGPGYTVVFQLNRRALLIEVTEREEPRVRSYEEVADVVARDFLERSRQELYRRLTTTILEVQEFRFHREAVEKHLSGANAAAREEAAP